MMRNLYFILCLLAFWPVNLLQGQGTISDDCESMLNSLTEPKLFGDLYQEKNKGVGSQYYIKEWLNGDVYLTNKNIVKNQDLRYNGFLDRLMWLTPVSYQQVKLDKDQIEGFCLNSKSGEKYYYEKITIKDEFVIDSLLVYGEVLYKSGISLLAYRKIDISGYKVIPQGSRYKDIYSLENIYFFRLANGKTIGFKRYRKHDIINLFPDKRELIIARFRELKQRHFRTEADLILVAKVLNEVL